MDGKNDNQSEYYLRGHCSQI